MNKIAQIFSLTLVFILTQQFLGCSLSQTQLIHIKKDTSPSWINNPKIKDNLSVVASSNITSTSFIALRDNAYTNSKISLQKTIEKNINSFLIATLQHTKSLTLQDTAKKISLNSIEKSKILKLFQNKNSKIFVLRSISTNIIIEDMQNYAKQLQDQTLYQTILLNINNGNLKYYLQNTN